jgi:hypothetical protein
MRRLILRSVALGFLIPALAAAQETCTPTTETTKLPAVSALLDSATLIKNLPAPAQAASKEVFVSVTTRPAPRAVVMDTLEAKTETGKNLADKVVASLKPNARNMLPAFRLRILLGEAPTLAVLPACAPTG